MQRDIQVRQMRLIFQRVGLLDLVPLLASPNEYQLHP